MNSWSDQHLQTFVYADGLQRCTAVFWISALLTANIVLLSLRCLARPRSPGMVAAQLLLAAVLLISACEPLIEFFGPVWLSSSDEQMLKRLFEHPVPSRAISFYVACISGLALLGNLALAGTGRLRWT
jgi:hypothetical protein